jgi:hypothetical protein
MPTARRPGTHLNKPRRGLESALPNKARSSSGRRTNGHHGAFPGKKSCVITEVLTHSSGRKSLHLVHTAGDLQELIAVFEPSLIEFARFMGCDQLLGSGRHGWERLGRAHGWRFAWTTLVKDIPPQ